MKRMARIVLGMVVMSFVIGLAAPVGAQQAPNEVGARSELEVQTQELIRTIEETKAEMDLIQEDIAASSGDDQEALEIRVSELAMKLAEDVQTLAAHFVAWDEQSPDAAAYRDQVAEILRRVALYIRRAIERLYGEMGSLAARHHDAAPEEAVAIEDRLVVLDERLNAVLALLLAQLEAMEDVGLAVNAERTFLKDFLQGRADLLAGRIELSGEELIALQQRAEANPGDAGPAAQVDLEKGRLDGRVANLEATVRMMESLGMDTTDYRQLLFEATGEITIGLMQKDVIAGIASTWTGKFVDWITNNGPRIGFKLLLFVLILLVFRLFSWISRKLVRKAIRTSKLQVSQLLERTALSVTGAIVMILGLLVALSQLGVKVGPMVAGLGVVGFIIGFALQDTLGRFAAGVMIVLYRPYDVGDLIETAGAFGTVKNMTLVSTTLLTLDHQTLVIPNSKIWGDVIKNVTAQKVRRIDMVFGISYSDDIPHAESVLEDIVTKHEGVLEHPEPVVKLHNLGESSVDFVVRPWVKTDDYWDVYWDITREVKMRFDNEGISIPFPQRDVHIIEEKATEGA